MSASPAPGLGPPGLPGYRFLQHLGSGGNSQVYLYEQDMPRRKVAVKVLNQAGLTDAVRRQFTAEANAMAGLAGHPHIVQVLTADAAPDGRPYLVMQYYPRPNLSVRARRERFSVVEVLRIGIQIGSAVETSHRSNILHRDIKPHNILTGQYGEPALTDFGIAARKGAGEPEGMSVPWSPPEILYGTSGGDERSDVYSLGATLWHLLAGRSPFEQPGGDNSTLALMRRIQAGPPPRIPRGDVPGSLEGLLRQAMARDPAMRPPTALDFVRALQAVEEEQRLPLTPIVLPDEPPSAGGPAPADGEVTLVRDARRVDPRPPAVPPAAWDRRPASSAGSPVRHEPAATDTTRARGAGRVDPWREPVPAAQPWREPVPVARPRRDRQLPAETPEADTRIRSAAAHPAVAAGAPGPADVPARPLPARVVWVVAGIAVVAAIGVAAAFPRHAASLTQPRPGSSAGDTPNPIVGGGTEVPNVPTVTVTRDGTGELRFRWTYSPRERGDVFLWRRVSGGTGPSPGPTTKQTLVVADPGGQSVCIMVEVVRDGMGSGWSQPACGP